MSNRPRTLADLQSVSKKLVVVTGISGSGKTTLASIISNKLNGVEYSVDALKVHVYESAGFIDLEERIILNDLAKQMFKRDVMLALRAEIATVVVEYPFVIEWQNFFAHEAKNYNYTLIVINCNTLSFDKIWERRLKRDLDETVRPKCLIAEQYISNKLFTQDNKLEEAHKLEQCEMYKNGYYTSITGDYNYTDAEIYAML